jgi:hypothetical protein
VLKSQQCPRGLRLQRRHCMERLQSRRVRHLSERVSEVAGKRPSSRRIDHGRVRQALLGGRDEHFALTCDDDELAIATPGPSKQREGTRGFGDLWRLVTGALTGADAIVFVGYRFPETDADARSELLGAIGNNPGTGSRSTLSIHIVLGNTAQSKRDAERLASMLRFVLGRNRIEATPARPPVHTSAGVAHFFMLHSHPLFAQDFFSVVNRDDLFWKE